MSTSSHHAITLLAHLIKEFQPNLAITLLEVGARPNASVEEPYMCLLDVFPNARVVAFEIEEQLCQNLNQTCHPQMRYYAQALGKSNGTQTLYETHDPLCSSLYKPNEALFQHYFQLEGAALKAEHQIEIATLDRFIQENDIGAIDMIKIDVQGAELDIFQGGEKALKDTVFIVTEVEYIPLYQNQPLFGDVSQFLDQAGFMFHHFLGFSGRCIKPLAIRNDQLSVSQLMWSDAAFMRNILELEALSTEALLKTALFAFIYSSPDVTYHCFRILDQREQWNLCQRFAQLGR